MLLLYRRWYRFKLRWSLKAFYSSFFASLKYAEEKIDDSKYYFQELTKTLLYTKSNIRNNIGKIRLSPNSNTKTFVLFLTSIIFSIFYYFTHSFVYFTFSIKHYRIPFFTFLSLMMTMIGESLDDFYIHSIYSSVKPQLNFTDIFLTCYWRTTSIDY